MTNQKSMTENAFFSFLKAFVSLIFPIITFPYASRILLPEGIGKVNFANSIINYFFIISSLGIGTYATREASKIRDNKIALSRFTKEMLSINLISTAVAYILFFITLFAIPKLGEYRNLLLVSSVNIILSTIGIDWIYTALEEFRYITLRSFAFQVIALVFLFTFVKTKDDIINYVIFGLISGVGSNVCNLIHSRRFIDWKSPCNLELKKHVKFVFTFFGMTVVTSIYTILDSTMLGFISGDLQVGYYSAATKLNKLVVSLLGATFGILLPRLSYYLKNAEENKFKELVQKSLSIMILISVPMVFGMILLAKPLVLIFSGENYLPAVSAMNIMSPIIFAMAVATITGIHVLPSIDKEKISLISYICGACINITLNSILIPKFGCVGAGIGTLVAEYTVTLTQIIYLRKMILTKETFKNLIQAFVGSVIMTGILVLLQMYIKNSIIQVVTCVLSGMIIYFLILLCFRNKPLLEIIKKINDSAKNKKNIETQS